VRERGGHWWKVERRWLEGQSTERRAQGPAPKVEGSLANGLEWGVQHDKDSLASHVPPVKSQPAAMALLKAFFNYDPARSLARALSFSLSLSPLLSLSFFFSLSLSVPLSFSLAFSLSLYISLAISLSFSLSLSVSLTRNLL